MAACAVALATAPWVVGGLGPPEWVFLGFLLGCKVGFSGSEARTFPLWFSVSPPLLGGEAQCWTRGSFSYLDSSAVPSRGPARAGQGRSSSAVGGFSRILQSSQQLMGCRGALHQTCTPIWAPVPLVLVHFREQAFDKYMCVSCPCPRYCGRCWAYRGE